MRATGVDRRVSERCPDCGGPLANVQGLVSCQRCEWGAS